MGWRSVRDVGKGKKKELKEKIIRRNTSIKSAWHPAMFRRHRGNTFVEYSYECRDANSACSTVEKKPSPHVPKTKI